ncbi:TSUP family transporter [Oligoflexus tunisiensis]|uniref:TSUP family transporter n=1 Tax=Oligoflexus tunisiensis TaxID=708132 RepID=UPI00159F1503|nr:TSUP family transporter [Oligoflexus tunisiensis]
MSLTWLGVYLAIAITSTLSGVLGMGGGMLLMGFLTLVLPTGTAMMLHGLAQMAANGSRVLLHIRHVAWRILPAYGLGAAGAVFLLYAVQFLPERWLIYLLMGSMPWFALYGKRLMVLDIEKPLHAVFCGLLVTTLQLASGVSGPALDIFYLHTRMSRHQIVASKAITQALGHGLKLLYYGSMLSTAAFSSSEILAVCGVALLGTVLGGKFLDKANDQSFQLWSRRIILLISVVYLVQGFYELSLVLGVTG